MTAEQSEVTIPVETEGRESLGRSINELAEQVRAVAANIEPFRGTCRYPDDYLMTNGVRDLMVRIQDQLQQPGTDPALLSRYLEVFLQQIELINEVVIGHQAHDPLGSFCDEVGDETVHQAFTAESDDGYLHAVAAQFLAEAQSGKQALPTRFLIAAQGVDSAAELLAPPGDEFSRAIRGDLLSQHAIFYMRLYDVGWVQEEDAETRQIKDQLWNEKLLTIAVPGLSDEEATRYARSAWQRFNTEDVASLIRRFDYFGLDRVRRITEFSGIYALECYSPQQLELMELIATKPEVAARQLDERDVTVLLVNRAGDEGAFRNDADNFEDGGRCVSFEISQMSDLYRCMAKLAKRGIRPSTIAISAHGNIGSFGIADNIPSVPRVARASVHTKSFAAHHNGTHLADTGDRMYAIDGSRGLSRMIDACMRPSRGIDDNVEDAGRVKVILNSCDGATPAVQKEVDVSGNWRSVGFESVVGQLTRTYLKINSSTV